MGVLSSSSSSSILNRREYTRGPNSRAMVLLSRIMTTMIMIMTIMMMINNM